ncbi:antitoxin [Streptomyces sp. KS 21]|uniref:antitoxin n=1 Tax=Streptomyces sp. KS 21 TaxID=2485150 RepID=UPI0010646183|nr:antitoxin [Streptomyces sp. KS 21]TDU77812.1 antitoxin protein of toxin-antitoxin system [Streptomyces sp. KS 21]
MGIFDRAKEMLQGHGKQAKQASDAAEQQVDQRTGNKYAKQVDQGQQQVEKQLGIDDDPNR